MNERYEIKLEITPKEAYDNMMGLLKMIKSMGIMGASRLIGVVEEKGWKSFLFDGDGDHRIMSIRGFKVEEG